MEKASNLGDVIERIFGNALVPLSPEAIQRNCDEMLNYVTGNASRFRFDETNFDSCKSIFGENRTQRIQMELKSFKILNDKQSECDELKKKIGNFERQKEQWEKQKRILESQQPQNVQVLQNEKRELRLQLNREQSEKEELFLQINTLISQLAEANSNKSEENSSASSQIEVLKNEMEKHKSEELNFLSNIENLKEELTVKQAEITSLNNQIKSLNVSISEVEHNLELKSAALQSLLIANKDTKNCEVEITQLKSENCEMKKEILLLNNHCNQMEDVVNENEKLKSDLERLSSGLNEKENIILSCENEILSKESEINIRNVKLKEFEGQHVGLSSKIAQLEGIINQKASLNVRFLPTLRQIERHVQRFSVMKSELAELRSNCENLRLSCEKDILRSKEITEEEINSLKDIIVRSKYQKLLDSSEWTKKVDDYEKIYENMKLLVESQKTELAIKDKNIDMYENRIRKLTAEVDESRALKELSDTSTLDKLGEVEKALNRLEIENRSLRMQISVLEAEKAKLSENNFALESENSVDVQALLESTQNDCNQKDDEICRLKNELVDSNENHRKIMRDMSSELKNVQDDLKLANSECSKWKETAKDYKMRTKMLENSNASLFNQISNLNCDSSEKLTRISVLLSNVEKQYEKSLLNLCDRFENKIKPLVIENNRLKWNLIKKVEIVKRNAEQQTDIGEYEIERLGEKMERLEAELESCSNRSTGLSNECQQQKNQINELSAKNERLSKELCNKEAEMAAKHQKEIKKLKNDFNEQQNELNSNQNKEFADEMKRRENNFKEDLESARTKSDNEKRGLQEHLDELNREKERLTKRIEEYYGQQQIGAKLDPVKEIQSVTKTTVANENQDGRIDEIDSNNSESEISRLKAENEKYNSDSIIFLSSKRTF